MFKFYLIVFIQLFLIKLVVNQFVEGNSCRVARTGGPGTCKLLSKCPSAIADIVANRGFPSRCGFDGQEQIICCYDPNLISRTTTPKPVLRNGISTQKCLEYTEYIYENISALDLATGQIVNKKTLNCGFISVPLIVGGTEAKSKEFPHMALIGFGDSSNINWRCGGSIISERYILTAGHCLRSREWGSAKYVRVGDLWLNTDKDDARPITMDIDERIPYPLYRTALQYYDIALLRLTEQIQFNTYVRPICLPQSFDSVTEKAIATGWGHVEWGDRNINDKLLKVTLDLFTYNECNDSFKYDINRKLTDGIKNDWQVCAGSHDKSRDTCQGDSGGPLQIYHTHPCMYEIVGVTSFGKVCGTAGYPSIYTRVFPYLDWIESIVFENN